MLPDISDINSYGGVKVNDGLIVDINTEEDANDRNEYVGDLAGMTHTIARAWCSFIPGASPTDPSTNVHDAVWGGGASVKPVVTKNGIGDYTVTWPTTVPDALAVNHTLGIRRAWMSVEGATPLYQTVTVASANSVRVRLYATSGSASDASLTSVVTVFIV